MDEILSLEHEIMEALPAGSAAADLLPQDKGFLATIAGAHDILCNAWCGPGERLDRLREISHALRSFRP